MSQRYFRGDSRRTLWIRAVLASAALFALLAARNVPPDFLSALSVHSTVTAASHHDQRPRFDNSALRWSAPAATYLPVPPVAESPHSILTPQLSSTVQTKGFHFNRPPPIS